MEILLNNRTSALCFNKDEFMVDDFCVDKFVSNCRKYVSLETMLEDFGLYHKILCSAMIELINKDYADFVNLSSNLVGLDKSIKNLSSPLQNLKSEVENEKMALDEILKTISLKFADYSHMQEQKILANHCLCIIQSFTKIQNLKSLSLTSDTKLSPENLERIALDLNLIEFHLGKISLHDIDKKKGMIQEIAENLKHHLESLFLASLSENDTLTLCKILRIYSINNKEEEVERYFAETIVRPYLQKHLTQERILKYGLSKVYEKVLAFIPTFCTIILNATRGIKKFSEVVPGYDFLVNAVFPEIVQSFELISPVHVYAPGDPELFHKNYSSTILFLESFEHHCEVQTSVQKLRKHISYVNFLKRWNLDVYYQIRFQEIAGKLENELLTLKLDVMTAIPNVRENDEYLLILPQMLLHCVQLCWNDKIFLQSLASQFFRLTLQLIARYGKLSHSSFEHLESEESLSPIGVAMFIKDTELLIYNLNEVFEKEISTKISRNHIESAFHESIKTLESLVPFARSLIVKLLFKQCVSHLKLITDIPRLYRKTNRTIPSKPSSYVSLVFDVLKDFVTQTESILSAQLMRMCLEQVVEGIINECFIMIQDVLTSIKKMEDSLRILKRARDKPQGQAPSGVVSDDDKIRRQLAIDIISIKERVQMLGLDVENLKNYQDLKQLVDSSERSSN